MGRQVLLELPAISLYHSTSVPDQPVISLQLPCTPTPRSPPLSPIYDLVQATVGVRTVLIWDLI